ncbi:hypothetical protein JT359_14170 [Candidatus Poribacteria bacterium]|nr:hypothetical protein [Candidatus Poribacteria bacterium]
MKYFLSILIIFGCLFSLNNNIFAFSAGPPDERTGAPDELTCATAGCHAGNPLNSGDGALVLTVPEIYTPGMVYDIIVELTHSGQSKWGFEMTALNSDNTRAGTFSKPDSNTQITETNDRQYIKHTNTGNFKGKQNKNSWLFKWTAPDTDVGHITFYTAGNASNGNYVPGDDYIYTQTATSEIITHGVSLSSNVLKKETTDANTGVEYRLMVTNTGNVEDTILLGSSAEVGIGGAVLGSFKKADSQDIPTSQLEIDLDAGESTEIIFIASGDLLTQVGDYPITVTALSKSEPTKSAEITTSTTILPIYGVNLSGVGELSIKTTDASTGVLYKFRVTNTGNTSDQINLSTSGDVTASLSQTTLTLSSGSSAEVTLTIPGSGLAIAGNYNVIVTATSNNDSSKTTNVTTATTILPVYGVTVSGVGDLTSETSDASDGITYKFTVSNTGNTEDVIDLSTSGDVSGTLSQSTVSLSYNSSTEVILTIPAGEVSLAGEYSVKITAISQGNTDKTADITTTTTILPVYDISITTPEKQTDITEGSIGYIFTLTNNGNTDDVINLSTTGDVTGTLSQESVTLPPGSSKDITLTVSTTGLTAGNYTLNVTGTSVGDNAITVASDISIEIGAVYGVMLSSEDELEGNTTDILRGVSYKLTLTNTGNIEDTIFLSSSAQVGIEGSVLGSFKVTLDQEVSTSDAEITVAPGSSVTVTFIAAGDSFTKPSDYEIIVKAKSKGDPTKSASVITTTTIDPVVWDLNADGIVNILDLVLVSNQFGESGENLIGDVNMDGIVNILDLVQVASLFNKSQVEIIEAMK